MCIILIISNLILAFIYAILILFVARKWSEMPIYLGESLPPNSESPLPNIGVSVIVAARNEAQNIGLLIESIAAQNFPKAQLELLIIDDNSDDDTANIIQKYKEKFANSLTIKYLYLKNGAGKKAAITLGVACAEYELLVTTDADCVPKTNDWLRLIASFFTAKQAKMVAAPVVFFNEKNALGRFQTADFVAMMGVTAAGIGSRKMWLCNGANLAYRRSVFTELNGFEGNMAKASGDDMFLMQKFAERYPNDIYFLKTDSASIQTEPKHDWQAFWAQRLRWGTKNTAYNDARITAVLGVVWLYAISFWANALALVGGVCFQNKNFALVFFINLVAHILLKMSIDFWLLRGIAPFFHKKYLLQWRNFLPSFFLYLYYMLAVGSLSLWLKNYEWKGRVVE